MAAFILHCYPSGATRNGLPIAGPRTLKRDAIPRLSDVPTGHVVHMRCSLQHEPVQIHCRFAFLRVQSNLCISPRSTQQLRPHRLCPMMIGRSGCRHAVGSDQPSHPSGMSIFGLLSPVMIGSRRTAGRLPHTPRANFPQMIRRRGIYPGRSWVVWG
ncbi:hypothetical protein BDP81DRAFT_117894 [Colletotrichum phormii]|uniref:Uncharacterized protein n=1 Tax=Colletotrichum phormii TaxID=359342 RepID=A0AAJ0E9E0_9PEZI|nr:uncharacterized protein BDP81DRAFT_117894 [Colletotrichum phormii]KAK1623834.1 hypothetical protein BDP81DRAFT_117894 [Colletotrichum phormii]